MAVTGSRVPLAFLIVATCLAQGVVADRVVLTLEVTYQSITQTFKFYENEFKAFYTYLCSSDSDTIKAYRSSEGSWVVQFDKETLGGEELQQYEYSNRYKCYRAFGKFDKSEWPYSYYDYYLVCQRIKVSHTPGNGNYCLKRNGCWSFRLINPGSTVCDSGSVEIIWDQYHSINVDENDNILIKTPCTGPCNAGITTTTTTTTTATATTTATKDLAMTTVGEKATVAQRSDDDDTSTIVGVVVSLIIIATILAVLGMLFWRRRRKTTARAKTQANQNGNSNRMSRLHSVSFHNEPTHHKPAMDTNATVDPSGIIDVQSTNDPEYYNHVALALSDYPESNFNVMSSSNYFFSEHLDVYPDYYNTLKGQSDSTYSNVIALDLLPSSTQ